MLILEIKAEYRASMFCLFLYSREYIRTFIMCFKGMYFNFILKYSIMEINNIHDRKIEKEFISIKKGKKMQERVPKYYLVKQNMIDKIDNEDFPMDIPIPSERELMELYQVSRITIRRAVDELVNEGYLYKIQGKGTYVKNDEKGSNLIAITSCTEDVIRLGMVPSKELVVNETVKADAKRAKLLEITSDDNVYRIGRILYANQEPLNYTLTYLPEKLFPNLEQYSLEEESLYKILQEKYGVKITKARRTMEAILAQDYIAEYLDVKEGSPIMLFRCITYGIVNGKEVPIESFKCYYRTDKFKFYIDQVR